VQPFQGVPVDAHVLESDMAQPQRRQAVDQVQALRHRAVAARQHEDEVHRLLPAPDS
jgi:hypothetical protein